MIDLNASGVGLDGYHLLAAQVQALFADERDFIANAAQFSAFLYNQVDDLNWAGFYLNRDEELVLGPFQGQVACVRIPFSRGVCGAAAATRQTNASIWRSFVRRSAPKSARSSMATTGCSPLAACAAYA